MWPPRTSLAWAVPRFGFSPCLPGVDFPCRPAGRPASCLCRQPSFDDGNGRMARLLLHFTVRAHGFPVLVIEEAAREDCMDVSRLADGSVRTGLAQCRGRSRDSAPPDPSTLPVVTPWPVPDRARLGMTRPDHMATALLRNRLRAVVILMAAGLLAGCAAGVGDNLPDVDGPLPRSDSAPVEPPTGTVARLPKAWLFYTRPPEMYGTPVFRADGGTEWAVTGRWTAEPEVLEGHQYWVLMGGLFTWYRLAADIAPWGHVYLWGQLPDDWVHGDRTVVPMVEPSWGEPWRTVPYSRGPCPHRARRRAAGTARLPRPDLPRAGAAGAGAGGARDGSVHGRHRTAVVPRGVPAADPVGRGRCGPAGRVVGGVLTTRGGGGCRLPLLRTARPVSAAASHPVSRQRGRTLPGSHRAGTRRAGSGVRPAASARGTGGIHPLTIRPTQPTRPDSGVVVSPRTPRAARTVNQSARSRPWPLGRRSSRSPFGPKPTATGCLTPLDGQPGFVHLDPRWQGCLRDGCWVGGHRLYVPTQGGSLHPAGPQRCVASGGGRNVEDARRNDRR